MRKPRFPGERSGGRRRGEPTTVQLVTRRQLRGAEVFAGQLAERLAAKGFPVSLIGLYRPAHEPLRARRVPTFEISARESLPIDPVGVFRLAQTLRRLEPDLVQANGSATLKYSVLAKRLSGSEFCLVYRNISIASHWIRGPLHRSLNGWLVDRVDHVVAVSQVGLEDFVTTYPGTGEKISVIPIGTEIPEVVEHGAARKRLLDLLSISSGNPLFASIGSFTPEKNQRAIVDAFGRVVDDLPDAHLVLIGEGPTRRAVQAHVRNRELNERVHFTGVRSDLESLIAGFDALLQFSSVEGLPGVILEASAHGVPTVAADVGSVAEIVIPGRTGILVPPGDQASLSRAILTIARSNERAEYGKAARELVSRRFSLDAVVDSFAELYRELIGFGPTPGERARGRSRAAPRS